MPSTPIGLGYSPGWTKTQAIDNGDHNTEKTCTAFDVSNSYSSTTYSGPVKKEPTKKECHQKVIKDKEGILDWMPRPQRSTATYNTGFYSISIPRQKCRKRSRSRQPRISINTELLPQLNMEEKPDSKKTLKEGDQQ